MNGYNEIREKDIVVLYHAGCTDGFAAAWAAWKKFGDSAAYVPMEWNKIPDGLVGKEVYTVDIALPESKIPELIAKNIRVTSIDHHESTEPSVRATQDYLFDRNHSGSVLSWKYFHPDIPVPRLLSHIEDLDFWRWDRDPDSRPITMLLTALGSYDFVTWDGLAKDLENDEFRHLYIEKGNMILQFQHQTVENLMKQAQLIEIAGYQVYSVNVPHFFASHTAGNLADLHPPFALAWCQERDQIHVSLRSKNDFDVSKVAQQFGGGGHPQSAGFTFPADRPLPWKIIKTN